MIQTATLRDAEEILALQKSAYISEAELYNDYGIQPLTQTLPELCDEMRTKVFLKLEAAGRIVGSVRACEKAGTCCIGKLVVHPDYRNRGLGARLMAAIEARFTDSVRYELFTGHNSVKNLYLYQKLGYRMFKTEKITCNLCLVFLEKVR